MMTRILATFERNGALRAERVPQRRHEGRVYETSHHLYHW
jgi:hypothetical protein